MNTKGTGQCRFCLEDDTVDNLISPCLCKGTHKYIHPDCLLSWWKLYPHKGESCNICLREFAKRYTYLQEIILEKYYIDEHYVKEPFYIFMLFYFVYWLLCIYYMSPSTTLYTTLLDTEEASDIQRRMYFTFQCIYQLYCVAKCTTLIYMVRNKYLYFQLWKRYPRLLIPIMYICSVFLSMRLEWYGSIATNTSMYIFYYEHLNILHIINSKRKVIFISL